MLNQSGERTLVPCIAPENTAHINTLFGIVFKEDKYIPRLCGVMVSVIYDSFIKILGRGDFYWTTVSSLPLPETEQINRISLNSLLLNSLSKFYTSLCNECFDESFTREKWSKQDSRLDSKRFSTLTDE